MDYTIPSCSGTGPRSRQSPNPGAHPKPRIATTVQDRRIVRPDAHQHPQFRSAPTIVFRHNPTTPDPRVGARQGLPQSRTLQPATQRLHSRNTGLSKYNPTPQRAPQAMPYSSNSDATFTTMQPRRNAEHNMHPSFDIRSNHPGLTNDKRFIRRAEHTIDTAAAQAWKEAKTVARDISRGVRDRFGSGQNLSADKPLFPVTIQPPPDTSSDNDDDNAAVDADTVMYDKNIPPENRSVSEGEYDSLVSSMGKDLLANAELPEDVNIITEDKVVDDAGFSCECILADIGPYTYTQDEIPQNLFLLVVHNESSYPYSFNNIYMHQLKVFIPPDGEYIMPEVTNKRNGGAPVSLEWTLVNNEPDGLHRYALVLPEEDAKIESNNNRQFSPSATITFPPKCQATLVVSNQSIYATFSRPGDDGNPVCFVPGTAQAAEWTMM